MQELTASSPMPYGKHKGKAMFDVPAEYLLWLYDNNKCSEGVAQYIEKNKDEIKERANAEAAIICLPYGKYKGVEISKVPAEYLLAIYDRGDCPTRVLEYIENNISRIEKQADKDKTNRAALRSMYK